MKRSIYILSLALAATGCADSDLLRPYGPDDGRAPAAVAEVAVRNFPGGATLRYRLPADRDLAYVKASFVGTDGRGREVRASGYVDSLRLEGFGDTRDYEVELRAYDKFENASQPVRVTVTPETPPMQRVFESLAYEVDFGGFVVRFENEARSDVAIYALRRDPATGRLEYYDVFYTGLAHGSWSVRGLPAEEAEFGLCVADRWGNVSPTMTFIDRPWPEEKLDKTLFRAVPYNRIPGDISWAEFAGEPSMLWNDVVGPWDFAHTDYPAEFPHRTTFDLGVKAKLSRIRTWMRPNEDTRWKHGTWKVFRIWGCEELPEAPSAADPLAGWTLLGDFVSVKPSGLPVGQESDDDIALTAEGEEFAFDRAAPAVRYLRIEVDMSWSGMKCSAMSELSLWGDVQEVYNR